MENNLDIIIDRIAQGICPICTRTIELEYQIVEDNKYGKVRICKNHCIFEEKDEDLILEENKNILEEKDEDEIGD
jgi:hypothetical protein